MNVILNCIILYKNLNRLHLFFLNSKNFLLIDDIEEFNNNKILM